MIVRMRRLGILVGLLLILAPVTGYASEITVRPFLIDETMLPRDSVMHPIRLTSDYDTRKSIVYATVNEIRVGPEGDIKSFVTPVETDRSRTITSWVEITRGRIEVPAG